MLSRSASLAMSTSILKALPGNLDIKRHSPSIIYLSAERYVVGVHKSHLNETSYLSNTKQILNVKGQKVF